MRAEQPRSDKFFSHAILELIAAQDVPGIVGEQFIRGDELPAQLDRRGVRPYRTEAETEHRAAQTSKAPAAEPAEKPQPAAASTPAPQPAAEQTSSDAVPPAEKMSWVDEPYQELLE